MVSGRTGGIFMIVSIFLPWWTLFISTSGYAFAGIWLFAALAQGNILGFGITQGALVSEFFVAIVLVILSGVLGIASTSNRKFSLAGGALGLFGALVFLVTLRNVSGGMPGSVFFGAESALGNPAFWFLSIGFWLAIISSLIMLMASRNLAKKEFSCKMCGMGYTTKKELDVHKDKRSHYEWMR